MPTMGRSIPNPDESAAVAPISDQDRETWLRHVRLGAPDGAFLRNDLALALDARLTIAEQQRDQALATLGLFADAKRIADRIEEGAKWVGEAERLRVALALIAEGHQAPMLLARQTLDRVALTRTAATPP